MGGLHISRLQLTGDVLDCPNECGTSRPPVGADRLVVSQRLLTDAITSLLDSTRGADAAAVVTKELHSSAGTVTEEVRIPDAPALWVCFSADSCLRLDEESKRDPAEQYLVVRRLGSAVSSTVQTFRGDSEALRPVLVVGSGVQFTLKCVQACTIKVAVRPLRGMWLGVRLSMRA